MNNDTPQPTEELTPENIPVVPSEPESKTMPAWLAEASAQPTVPKQSDKKIWIILGITVVVLACCCLVGIAAIIFAAAMA